LGDILKDEGYNQAFMCGSPVAFGSREVYLRSHGCDDFLDYDFAASNGLIPKGYKVWWGFEDRRLFEFAKTKVRDMASSYKPFALTILTADTHFEDGYVCELCGKEYDTQYSNVIACSSKQVSEFVTWLKQQDFYDDTTIILSGDHITMDADYCNNVDPSYERKTYTNIINPAVKPVNDRHREYTTFDLFPTTLAAMGATINGNRLGLGTNLFSERETLTEEYGQKKVEDKFNCGSRLMEKMFNGIYKSPAKKSQKEAH
jgi:phosphoglycerol transferase